MSTNDNNKQVQGEALPTEVTAIEKAKADKAASLKAKADAQLEVDKDNALDVKNAKESKATRDASAKDTAVKVEVKEDAKPAVAEVKTAVAEEKAVVKEEAKIEVPAKVEAVVSKVEEAEAPAEAPKVEQSSAVQQHIEALRRQSSFNATFAGAEPFEIKYKGKRIFSRTMSNTTPIANYDNVEVMGDRYPYAGLELVK